MGANALAWKEWALNEALVTCSSPIEHFNDRRIGIDAEDYVHSLLTTGETEPLLSALGGLPLSLRKQVDRDLHNFQEAAIEPFFVFNGLDLACKDGSSVLRESRKASVALDAAWQVYDRGDAIQSVTAFAKAPFYRTEHLVRSLQLILSKRGVLTQCAPYSAAAQLAYLERAEIVDGVAGSASCLVFGCEKVITSFNWESKEFIWVPLTKCLNKMGLPRDQFFNVCLLSGSSILPTLPEIDSADPTISKMTAARALISRVGNDAHNLFLDMERDYYRLQFWKALSAVKHAVILTEEGRVEPLNWDTAPGDVHEFIGHRLPDEIYFYLSRFLVGPRVLNWRTHMQVLEVPPLDCAESEPYKNLILNSIRALRAQALALMTHSLNRYYQKTDVHMICWWDEGNKIPLRVPDVSDPTAAAETWHVKKELLSSTGPSTPLAYAIASLAKDSEAKKTYTIRAPETHSLLREHEEVRANIVWRFLQDRGYINSDHTLSAWGKALKISLDRATSIGLMALGVNDVEIEEAVLLAFELLRLDLLNSKDMFPAPPYSGGPIRGSPTDKAHTMLVSRLACLLQLRHKEIGYSGPLSRNLLGYHQMAAAVRGALRDLVEMHACNMFCSGVVDRGLETDEVTDLGTSLPFTNEPNLGLGVLVRCYLDEQSQNPTKRPAMSEWFSQVEHEDIPVNLEKAWKFWDAVNTGVQAAERVNAETKKTFMTTEEWLVQKRDPAYVPNGTA